ncbi:MAG TPA: glycosyltransferase [Chitinophagaceae bacterium]|nr:glycosyltransferase [Chitinophagaceae bacterium]
MKILGLISSENDPASRTRIKQYKKEFASQNVLLSPRYFTPLRDKDPSRWMYRFRKTTGVSEWRIANFFKIISRLPLLQQQKKYDIIWENRLLLPHHSYFERRIKKPLVFDYDDAIWINEGEKQVQETISKSTLVFAGNEYLAEYGSKYNKKVCIIPTTVDTEILYPQNKINETFVIGWIGTKSNFSFLEIIKQPIIDFLSQNSDSKFVVVSSEEPPQFKFDEKQVCFIPWSAENENNLINQFSVGIMPLPDNEYTRGKCSYKMLQYMACGKPAIVSPVGMNQKILSEDEVGFAASEEKQWFDLFVKLKNDDATRERLGQNGRMVVEEKYSIKKYAPIILEHFSKLI